MPGSASAGGSAGPSRPGVTGGRADGTLGGGAPARRPPQIDVLDSTWIGAAPQAVAAAVAEPSNWRRWWPDLDLEVQEWRGAKGVRWRVRPGPDGLIGSMEIWLEPDRDGVVLHYFLRLDPAAGGELSVRQREQIAHRHRTRAKQSFWELADRLDPGRLARVSRGRS